MALTLSVSGRGTRQRARATARSISDINVTPMVDVMLVLLVIFMVTAPLLTVGVPVDLPETEANAINEPTEPLTITLSEKGEIFLQETLVDLETLVPRLKAITGANPEARIFVRGDKQLVYGRVMQVMGLVNSAGFHKVALVAEIPKPGTSSPSRGSVQRS